MDLEVQVPSSDFGGNGETLHFHNANGYPPACYLPLFNVLNDYFHLTAIQSRPLWPGSSPDGLKDWHGFSDDYLRFISQNPSGPVLAVGHSMGGIIALRAALRQQDKFRGLVLIDPVLFHPWQILIRRLLITTGMIYRFHPLIKTTRFRRRQFTDLDKVFQGFRQKPVFRYFDDASLKAYVDGIVVPKPGGGYQLAYSPEWEMHIYATGVWNDLDLWRNLYKLKIPLLVIRGDETDTFNLNAFHLLKRRRPDARLLNLTNATHLIPLERPQEVGKAIIQFAQEML